MADSLAQYAFGLVIHTLRPLQWQRPRCQRQRYDLPERLVPVMRQHQRKLPLGLIAACLMLMGTTIAAAADAQHGQDLFKDKCQECHTVRQGGANKKGPNLFGIVGRQTGSVADFKYSDANKNSQQIWSEDNLVHYLQGPRDFMPGTKMKFKGFKQSQDAQDVVEYLKTLK